MVRRAFGAPRTQSLVEVKQVLDDERPGLLTLRVGPAVGGRRVREQFVYRRRAVLAAVREEPPRRVRRRRGTGEVEMQPAEEGRVDLRWDGLERLTILELGQHHLVDRVGRRLHPRDGLERHGRQAPDGDHATQKTM